MLRRSLMSAAAACAASLALPRLSEAAVPAGDRQILHVLDRLAFGPTQEDVAHIRKEGIERYIAEQLDPRALADPPDLAARLAGLETLRLDPIELFVRYGPPRPADGAKPSPDEVKARREA